MLIAPSFYNTADQNIFNQGNRFITQQPYRLGDPTPMSTGTGGAATATGINTLPINMNMGGGGGEGGYNPYTPNNNVRTDFRPNYEFRQFQDFGNLTSDQLTTAQNKEMDMYSDYYRGPPESGLSKFASKAIDFVPFIGTAKRIAGFFSDKIPINQRAILENQLRGQGVLTDDIGRIALGQGMSYNTPEGIMAGYNASKMNEGTFDKRTDKISETLGSKYGISQADIQGLIDGTLDDDDISSKYGINTNLTSNIRNITLAKQNFITQQNKAAEIAAFKEKQRQEKKQAAANARDLKTIQRRAAQGDSMSDIGRDMYTGKGQAFEKQSGGVSGKGTKNERNYGGRRDGGFIDGTNRRTDYMMGGLANLVDIYD
jgi:hypothetical protein